MLENKFKRRGDATNASGVTLSSVRTSDEEKTDSDDAHAYNRTKGSLRHVTCDLRMLLISAKVFENPG